MQSYFIPTAVIPLAQASTTNVNDNMSSAAFIQQQLYASLPTASTIIPLPQFAQKITFTGLLIEGREFYLNVLDDRGGFFVFENLNHSVHIPNVRQILSVFTHGAKRNHCMAAELKNHILSNSYGVSMNQCEPFLVLLTQLGIEYWEECLILPAGNRLTTETSTPNMVCNTEITDLAQVWNIYSAPITVLQQGLNHLNLFLQHIPPFSTSQELAQSAGTESLTPAFAP